jgi:glycosyltransferase involved in cell wall biosynthesis
MRILFVGYPDSIHTARWINQLAGEQWDIHLFPIHDGPVHPDLVNATVHSFYKTWPYVNNEKVNRKGLPWPILQGRGKIKAILEKAAPDRAGDSARLAQTIRSLKPDVLHVLEMQQAGYLTLDSLKLLAPDPVPPCIYSSWGSDFYRYGREAAHEDRIRKFLDLCDYYIADCRRDLDLARHFGFHGEVLGVFPVGGGFDLQYLRQFSEPQPSAARKVIAVKGYHGERLWGRALVALAALRQCEDLLKHYEVIVYSADREVSEEVLRIAGTTGIRIAELPQSPHSEIIQLMGRSRMSISIGLTDGTPNSLLEAMIMGAFPIQSDTVSTGEWIESGKNGWLAPPEDSEAIAAAIRQALTHDELVNEAAEMNAQITAQRVDEAVIKPQVIEMYKKVVQAPPKRERAQTATVLGY